MIKKEFMFLMMSIPLLTVVATMGGIIDVDAYTKSNQERLSPKSFGSKTNVCGDKLCSEVTDQKVTSGPNLEVVDVYPLAGNFHKILLKVTSDFEPIFKNVIYVTSDIDTRVISVPFINANSHDYATTTIRALDSSSIEAVYAPGKAVVGIDADIPRATLIDVSNISDQEKTYRVIFDVTTKDFNAKNIKIKITSDIDSITYSVGGLFENNTQTNQVILKAQNPQLVSVQVIDYEINR